MVIPVYEEEENLRDLHEKILESVGSSNDGLEIIYVDDGSQDGSFGVLKSLAAEDKRVKVIRLRRNFGQTAALSAGFYHARGNIIVTMDADRQNEPADVPKLLAKMDEGFDVVSGWRADRKEPFLTRKFPSKMASVLISKITGLKLHDYGCPLKAYRREAIESVNLYGDMHRIIPAFVHWNGYSVVEVEVQHYPRMKGQSKYGMSRIFKVLLDITAAKFLNSYSTRPIHMFGALGFLSMGSGVVAGIIVMFQKYFSDVFAHRNPVLFLAVFLFLLGMQFIVLGLLAELLARTYYESQEKQIFLVKETVNLPATELQP